MEEIMRQYLAIGAVLTALMSFAHAQQREGILRKIEMPNAGFDLVVATAKPGGSTSDFRSQPDPNLVYLAGGTLVYSDTGPLQELLDAGMETHSACTFQVPRRDNGPRTPVAVYVIPKGAAPLIATKTWWAE
jgi:hypothetical protein